jgi:hypothetical protein
VSDEGRLCINAPKGIRLHLSPKMMELVEAGCVGDLRFALGVGSVGVYGNFAGCGSEMNPILSRTSSSP